MKTIQSRVHTIIGLGLMIITLSACSQSVSTHSVEENSSYISVNKSIAWYDYFPVSEESEVNNTLYATITLTLFNDSSLTKTYSSSGSISYNNVTYPVSITFINADTNEAWNSEVLARETKRLVVKIDQGPTEIEEGELITIHLTLTDSEGTTFQSTVNTEVLYTW